jgi:hypothetical protein
MFVEQRLEIVWFLSRASPWQLERIVDPLFKSAGLRV